MALASTPIMKNSTSLAAKAAFLTAFAACVQVAEATFEIMHNGDLYECLDSASPFTNPRLDWRCKPIAIIPVWNRLIGVWISLIILFVILAIFLPVYCCVRASRSDYVAVDQQPTVVYTTGPAAPVVYQQQQPGVQVVYAGESDDSDYEV